MSRFSPTNLLRRFGRGASVPLALIVLCTMATSSSAETEAEYKARLSENLKKIQRLEAEVVDAREKRQSLLTRLGAADGKIQGRNNRIKELRQDISEYSTQVENLEASLRKSQALIASTRQSLGKLMQASLQVRSNDGLQVMLQHTDPALSSRLGIYYDYFFRATSARIADESAMLETGRRAHHEALKSRNWLKYIEKKAKKQKEELAGTKTRQQRQLTELDNSLEQKEQLVQNLRKDQERLGNLLEELRKNAIGASGFFTNGKGKYPWPVTGERHASFGQQKSVGKLSWQGLFITAAEASPVRAIADGETVYADWLQGFGMLVILDHGDGYMTLYGGNRELQVKAGDWVEYGARIATVGDSGGLNRHGLYFEVRHNAKPVDPELWVDSKNQFPKSG